MERYATFTALITELNRAIHKIKTKEMEEYDLKSMHVSCIYYLYEEGSMTASNLCELCKEDKATISRSVLFLQENGFIVREDSGSKRYNTPIILTERGKMLGKKLSDKVNSVLSVSDLGISAEERATMYKCLELINNNLQEYCKKYDA